MGVEKRETKMPDERCKNTITVVKRIRKRPGVEKVSERIRKKYR